MNPWPYAAELFFYFYYHKSVISGWKGDRIHKSFNCLSFDIYMFLNIIIGYYFLYVTIIGGIGAPGEHEGTFWTMVGKCPYGYASYLHARLLFSCEGTKEDQPWSANIVSKSLRTSPVSSCLSSLLEDQMALLLHSSNQYCVGGYCGKRGGMWEAMACFMGAGVCMGDVNSA